MVAAIGFSCKAILVKLAYLEGIAAVLLFALWMICSVPVFLLIAALEARKSEKLSHQNALKIAARRFVGYYLSSLFDFMELQHISAGLERLIFFLYPSFVVILLALFFRQPARPYQIGAPILCYSGIAIVYFHESMTENPHLFIGSILVLTSYLTYSGYLIGSGNAAMIGGLGPVATILMAAYFLNEPELDQGSVAADVSDIFPCQCIGCDPAGLIGMPFSPNLNQGGGLFATIVHCNHWVGC